MGQNLILNMNDHGNVVCAYNRTPDKVTKFLENEAKNTNVSPYRMIYLLLTKGQLISKYLFGVFNFFQKPNENKSIWGIIVVKLYWFVFFGRNVGLKKSFRLCVTFKGRLISESFSIRLQVSP